MTTKTPSKSSPRWLPWAYALGLIVLTVGLALLFINRRPDRAYIAYRYAQNLHAGLGFVYNPGEPVLVAGVAPLWAAFLSVIARFTDNLPLVGALSGAVGLGLAALGLLAMPARRAFRGVAAGAAALMLLVPVLWFTLGLEVPLWLGLCLLGMAAYVRGVEFIAALLLGAATLLNPLTLILIGVIVTAAIVEGRAFKPWAVSVLAVILLGGLLWLVNTFDNPFSLLAPAHTDPDLLAQNAPVGLFRFAAALGDLSFLWALPLVLAVPGALRLKEHRWALLPLGWAGLHLVVISGLGLPVYPWSFAPLLPALAVLAALGVEWIGRRVGQPMPLVAGLAALLMLGAAGETTITMLTTTPGRETRWQALTPALVLERDIAVGEWLAANTPPSATVGLATGADLGTGALGYISNRPLVDFRGTLQPELAAAYARGDGQWWLAETLPEFLVLSANEALYTYQPTADPWFEQTYTRVESIPGTPEAVIFQRGAPPPPLTETLINAQTYNEVLLLTSVASDVPLNPLEGGQLARLRLTWRLEAPLRDDETVIIQLQGRGEEGSLAAFDSREIDFSRFPVGEFVTTYHTLEIAPGLPNGVYDVRVAVGEQAADVMLAKVPFPDAEFLGALRGLTADYGEMSVRGYRIARLPEGLEVLLIWQMDEATRTDYRFLVQLRDPNGGIVRSVEAAPKNGTYPTSAWDAGERQAETILLDVDGLPAGEYQVYVGLLNPDGERLLTMEGEETVFVGSAILQ